MTFESERNQQLWSEPAETLNNIEIKITLLHTTLYPNDLAVNSLTLVK